jgi:tetratricopeptide (TPR) repeat protein
MAKLKYLLTFIFCLILTGYSFAQYNFESWFSGAKNDIAQKNYAEAIKKLNICIKVKSADCPSYFYRGYAKFCLNDNLGAQQDMDLATSNYSAVYYDAIQIRAIVKDRLEDYQGAINDFNKVIEKEPGNGVLYEQRSFSKLSSQDYYGAIRDCNKALSLHEISENIYLCRGMAETELNEFDNALSDYEKAMAINPQNENAYVRRGITKAKMSDYCEAIEDYDLALKIDSGCTYAYFNRAEARIELKDEHGALTDYNSLLQYEPTNALALYNRAALKSGMKDYKGAIADFDRVLLLNPKNIQALFNRAKVKHNINDFKGALSDYDKTIELFPYFVEAYYNRSLLKKSIGDFSGAKKDYETGRVMSEMNHSKGLAEVTRDSITLMHLSEFNADFENVNNAASDTIDIHLMPIYNIAFKDDNVTNASGYRPLLLKSGKNDFSGYYLTNKMTNSRSASVDSTFVESASNNESLNEQLKKGIQKTNSQLFNDAVKIYDKIIEDDSKCALAYFARGINECHEMELLDQFDEPVLVNQPSSVLQKQKDEICKKALANFNMTLKLEPAFAAAYFNRAEVKSRMQDFNGAVKDYDNAIKADPEFGDAYYNRGMFLLYMKDKLNACADFSKAGELGMTESYSVIKKYCPHVLVK